MLNDLSIVMIAKNSESLLAKSLESIVGLSNEIVLVDNNSIDNTLKIAKKYKVKVYEHQEEDLGLQRAFALSKVKTEWVLVLDCDERVSRELKFEIEETLGGKCECNGFFIPFQNHIFGHSLHFGGEDYKMLRLFRKKSVRIDPSLVHEKFVLNKGKVGTFKNKIYHYSYRSLGQIFGKFKDYALREAKSRFQKGENVSFKKVFLYPVHMFWARFIKDKGYKDGLIRLPLDFGFAYMEFLTYVLLLYFKLKNHK